MNEALRAAMGQAIILMTCIAYSVDAARSIWRRYIKPKANSNRTKVIATHRWTFPIEDVILWTEVALIIFLIVATLLGHYGNISWIDSFKIAILPCFIGLSLLKKQIKKKMGIPKI
jgi:hypothetical protein